MCLKISFSERYRLGRSCNWAMCYIFICSRKSTDLLQQYLYVYHLIIICLSQSPNYFCLHFYYHPQTHSSVSFQPFSLFICGKQNYISQFSTLPVFESYARLFFPILPTRSRLYTFLHLNFRFDSVANLNQ